MNNKHHTRTARGPRSAAFALLAVALGVGATLWGAPDASANHPVLVEGNCDSPVPGTTLVAPGTCGDFDGDGRIGTAEDTDGADRIFGTLRAALGPGIGAAAGTGANFNGKIIIVASGRFAENLYIGNAGFVVGEGTANPGNVTIEAAPGVNADIDAVLQGDPAGGNANRQLQTGIAVIYTNSDRVVTLRNLQIRNWFIGIGTALNTRLHIDNCRLEGNLAYGVRAIDSSRVVITNTQVDSTGFRIGGPSAVASPGTGISNEPNSQMAIASSNVSHSAGCGINNTAPIANVSVYQVGTYFNGGVTPGTANLCGSGVTFASNPNFSAR